MDNLPILKSPKAVKTLLENYIYTPKGLQTNPGFDSPTMPDTPYAYQPPDQDIVHPMLNLPMHEVRSLVAKIHGQEVFNRTNFCHKPPAPLSFQAEHVLLATNKKVLEDTIAPFCCAELISSNAELNFLVDGRRHIVTGDAYIQFNYFSGDRC